MFRQLRLGWWASLLLLFLFQTLMYLCKRLVLEYRYSLVSFVGQWKCTIFFVYTSYDTILFDFIIETFKYQIYISVINCIYLFCI